MKTAENEKLAQGESYPTKVECLHAIERVRSAASAELQDLCPYER